MPITTNYAAWEKSFRKSCDVKLKSDKKNFAKAASLFYLNVVKYTPVGKPSLWKSKYVPKGYTPGNLKKSWKIKFNSTGTECQITNDAVYAMRIEYGWSTQAPQGMLRRALLEYPDILRSVRYS